MLSVTVRSCLEEFKAINGDCEVVICDNSDEEVWGYLPSCLPTGYVQDGLLRLLRQDFPCLFTAREEAAKQAKGEYIVCLDSHMVLGRDTLKDLVDFMDRHSGNPNMGFAHAPVNWIHQHERNARHDRDMSQHELGEWGPRYDHERTITWKGMPWICRREWFLNKDWGLGGYGALSAHRLSWGGGDMHIGVKPWLLGYENWAVPTSPAHHIGPFPKIDQALGKDGKVKDKNSTTIGSKGSYAYRLYGASGKGPHAVGFLVSCYVLGGEPMMKRNEKAIENRFGRYINLEAWWKRAMRFGEKEKAWLDMRKVMTFEELLETRPWDNYSRQKISQVCGV